MGGACLCLLCVYVCVRVRLFPAAECFVCLFLCLVILVPLEMRHESDSVFFSVSQANDCALSLAARTKD